MNNSNQQKRTNRLRRQKRTRAKIQGTAEYPRLSVFRSNKHIYAQLIDDQDQKTLVACNDHQIKEPKQSTKKEIAKIVGIELAKKATKLNIKKAVFDRGGYLFHGRVKSVAEGAREGGLKI